MRKLRVLFVAVLLALPAVGASASPALACTDTTDLSVCDTINRVCQKVGKANCVG